MVFYNNFQTNLTNVFFEAGNKDDRNNVDMQKGNSEDTLLGTESSQQILNTSLLQPPDGLINIFDIFSQNQA